MFVVARVAVSAVKLLCLEPLPTDIKPDRNSLNVETQGIHETENIFSQVRSVDYESEAFAE